MQQGTLFDDATPTIVGNCVVPGQTEERFNGADYVPDRDNARLTGQLLRVWNYLSDYQPHTLQEIADATGDPPASVSAQIRHLRKDRFGAHTIDRSHLGNGLYDYTLKRDQ